MNYGESLIARSSWEDHLLGIDKPTLTTNRRHLLHTVGLAVSTCVVLYRPPATSQIG